MKRNECGREQEIVRAMLMRQWPEAPDPDRQSELQLHAQACEVCAEIVTVAALMAAQRDDALRDAHVPAAGQVWWRAALRARAEANQAARRPMLWLHGVAGACAVGIGVALIGLAWPSMRESAAWISLLGSELDFGAPDVTPLLEAVQPAVPVALALVACLVLTPLVVYFALSDD